MMPLLLPLLLSLHCLRPPALVANAGMDNADNVEGFLAEKAGVAHVGELLVELLMLFELRH